jgi:putative Mn2+ efflux pump MntP
MAIATLSAGTAGHEPRYAQTVGVALRFALGHAMLLAAGTAGVFVLGWNIPVVVEQAGETVGGLLLIGLGAMALWAAWTRRVYVHRHSHAHAPGQAEHSHWHVHLGREHRHPVPASHSALPGFLGGVFAVSGLRALTLLTPFEDVRTSLVSLLALVAIFAVGILLSMSVFGILLARVMRSPRVTTLAAEAAALTTAFGSIALALYWISG